jgi:hypothetical protein
MACSGTALLFFFTLLDSLHENTFKKTISIQWKPEFLYTTFGTAYVPCFLAPFPFLPHAFTSTQTTALVIGAGLSRQFCYSFQYTEKQTTFTRILTQGCPLCLQILTFLHLVI